jgi:hypothetical protein
MLLEGSCRERREVAEVSFGVVGARASTARALGKVTVKEDDRRLCEGLNLAPPNTKPCSRRTTLLGNTDVPSSPRYCNLHTHTHTHTLGTLAKAAAA